MATGLLTKGIKLSYEKAGQTPTFVDFTNLKSTPDLGSAPEKVEITTLKDGNRKYINGIKDYGDLEFTFVYDNVEATDDYRILQGLEAAGTLTKFKLTYPDGTVFAFSGYVSTTMAGSGINEAVSFKANITLATDITITHPAAAGA